MAERSRDPDCYHAQNNNPEENALHAQMDSLSKQYGFTYRPATFFESCGPTACVNALDAKEKGYLPEIRFPGGWAPQQESMVMSYFNDPRNFKAFAKVVPGIDFAITPANRIAALYPMMVESVFGKHCIYQSTKIPWAALMLRLIHGDTVQLCLVNPGHFITAVDIQGTSIVYNDPWDGRGGISGFRRVMTEAEYNENVRPYALIY